MSLGADNKICTAELVEAMRASLEAKEAGLGANVDEPGVRKNFEALGEAVFRVLTLKAETTSAAAQDTAYWAWVASMTAHAQWLDGLRAAFANWTPADAPGQQLRAAILALTQPGATPTAPTQLAGKLR